MEASHARLSEAEIMAAKDWVSERPTSVEAPTPSPETTVLLERVQELLGAGTLAPDDQVRLQELTAAILEAQGSGNAARLEELLDTLLDALFDLEG